MGTYYIPRNVKGESRILYIFSVKSLITTLIGGAVGFIFYLIFSIAGLTTLGWISIGLFGLIGFVIGAVKIPTVAGIPITKKIGGESIDQIILRYIKFKKTRKIYVYTKEEKKDGSDSAETSDRN